MDRPRTGNVVLKGRGHTAEPHHDKTRLQIERDISQSKPGDDLTLPSHTRQNDTQDTDGDRGPKIKTDPIQALRSKDSELSPRQKNKMKYSDRQKATRREPDGDQSSHPSGTDNKDGDTCSSGGRQQGGGSRRPWGQSSRGRGAGKQGPQHDRKSQGTPTGPTFEGGGVPLANDELPRQPPSYHHQAKIKTKAEPRSGLNSNQQGEKLPGARPSKSQQFPDQLLDTKNAELETTIHEMEEQISELKKTISWLHKRDGDPTKADSHFATRFSNIIYAIEQWVVRHCLTDPDVGLWPTELQELLRMVSCEPEKHVGSHGVCVVRAVVAQLLSRRVLYSHFLVESETAWMLGVVASKLELQGTFYQCQRWRALTMSVLAKGDDFEGGLATYVDRVTEELGYLLKSLSTPESDNIRRKSELREIVEQGAKLTVEIRKQPDLILLDQVPPGSLYSAQYMQDKSCLHSDSELEGGAATVRILIFPIVVRYSCVREGSSAVVMKAKVIAELPSLGEVLVE